jgi:hypothetical protein
MNITTTLVDETGRELTPADVVGCTARIVTGARVWPEVLIRGYGCGLLVIAYRLNNVTHRNYVEIGDLKPGSELNDDIPTVPTMTVRVSNRGTSRSYEGVRTTVVTIVATCPRCNGPRGYVHRGRVIEDGEHYSVDVWENPCGHEDSYADVLVEAGVHLPKHLRDAA